MKHIDIPNKKAGDDHSNMEYRKEYNTPRLGWVS